MSRAMKIVLSTVLVVGLAVGYGIYWWYGSEAQTPTWVQAMNPVETALRDVRTILARPDGTHEQAAKRLSGLGYDFERPVVFELAQDPDDRVRLFAVTALLRYQREPEGLALLERMARDDASEVVRGAAYRIVQKRHEDQNKPQGDPHQDHEGHQH